MAIDTTILVPVNQTFPWSDTGAPNPAARDYQPMGELYATVLEGPIGAPGTGDNSVVRCDITLPVNFVYSLIDLSATIGGLGLASTGNWENIQSLIIFDLSASPPVPNKRYGVNLVSDGVAQVDTFWSQSWRPASPIPTYLFSGGSILQMRFTNLTDDDIAATLNLTGRFLQYTVTQEFDAGVNTPQLIR